jgi:hypothetical protein
MCSGIMRLASMHRAIVDVFGNCGRGFDHAQLKSGARKKHLLPMPGAPPITGYVKTVVTGYCK